MHNVCCWSFGVKRTVLPSWQNWTYNQFRQTGLATPTDNRYSRNSVDDFHPGFQNISHPWKFFSELPHTDHHTKWTTYAMGSNHLQSHSSLHYITLNRIFKQRKIGVVPHNYRSARYKEIAERMWIRIETGWRLLGFHVWSSLMIASSVKLK